MDVLIDALPSEVVLGASGIAEIMQNVRMILTTRKGTVPLDRNFGVSFEYLDAPVSVARGKMEQEVFQAIRKYEPRAIIRKIDYDFDPEAGHIKPNVKIEVVQ